MTDGETRAGGEEDATRASLARAREKALRDVLQVISQSRDDEMPVFEAIIERAARLCHAQAGGFQLANDAGTHLILMCNWGVIQGVINPGFEIPMDSPVELAVAVREGRVISIADLKDTAFYKQGLPGRVQLVEEEGVRSWLIVPLLRDGVGFGSITLARHEVRPFLPDEIALVETFADQAVIAIENVRQFREVQTRLERERASAEVLGVISQSRDDEMPVFDVILRNAAFLSGAPLANLCLLNDVRSHWQLAAHFGDGLRHLSVGKINKLSDSNLVPAVTMRTASVVHIEDLTDTDLYRQGDPGRVAMVEAEGMRTILGVPLLLEDEAIGCITLFRREVKAFTSDEIALLETFAAQAVIAIENVRQFREVQDRLEREQALAEVLEVISRSRDDEKPVLDIIVQNAARLTNAKMAGISLVNTARTELSYAAVSGEHTEHFPEGYRFDLTGPLQVAVTVREARVIHTLDLADDPLYTQGDPVRRTIVDDVGIRTFLTVPLIKDGIAFGCLNLNRNTVQPFNPDELQMIESFAAQAVIAIENVRQFREVQERLERETATKNILRVISQSRNDEGPVFDAILENACTLCNAPLAGLILGTPKDEVQTLAAQKGMFSEAIDLFETGQMRMDGTLSYAAKSIIEGRLIAFDDMGESDLYKAGSPVVRSMVDASDIRSVLFVPLMKNGIAIGNLTVFRHEVSPFDRSEITLIESFAAQAVIAIENVRQFREVQDRLEREIVTGQVLEVISRSRDDDLPVFNTILENAVRLCGADRARLMLITDDGTGLRAAGQWGEANPALPDGAVIEMIPEMLPVRSILEKQSINEKDGRETEGYRKGVPQVVANIDEMQARSILTVPLIKEGVAIGCIVLTNREIAAYDDGDVSLVETFAAQAVIAIENVRQFREVQERLEREKASGDVLEVISKSRDDDLPVFSTIAQAVSRLCNAPLAYVCILNSARSHVTIPAQTGARSEFAERLARFREPVEKDWLIAVRASLGKAVIRIDDLKDDDLYRDGNEYRVNMVDEEGMRSVAAVPLINGDEGVGCIFLYRREVSPFSDDDIALVQSFAAQAVIAIENVHQFKALETLNAELGDRVEEQVGEIERMGKLKQFLPSAVADTVVSAGSEKMLSSHRALLGVLFCDIRGFTAFCETAEPEETIEVLQTYHEEMGKLIEAHGAGVDHRMGDGIMVLFNDPLPCDDPAGDALRLALAMRVRMEELCAGWKRLGHRLGFGVGISLGYATVGMVGFGGRYDYTASGTAVNLAARLCDQAQDQEILLSQRAATATEEHAELEPAGDVMLKGFHAPVSIFRVVAMKEQA